MRTILIALSLVFWAVPPGHAEFSGSTGHAAKVFKSKPATGTRTRSAIGLTSAEGQVSGACQARAKPYKVAIAKHNRSLNRYWSLIGTKRAQRKRKKSRGRAIVKADYVLGHPPVYSGPKRPKCLDAGKEKPKAKKSTIGVEADFRKAARDIYGFVPRRTSEQNYKERYAAEALALGLTESQVLGVYALETGGIGPYFRQSGIFPVDQKCQPITPKGRPASTALGYAQLLAANSSVMVVEKGEHFADRLERAAVRTAGTRREELINKANVIRRMRRDVKRGLRRYKNRNNWREYVKFSKTRVGYAVHVLNIDADVGPMLQVHKLKKIVDVAHGKGFRSISGAQLELLNLVGYGRGLEMMTPAAREAATANFFNRGGYYRNPVAKNRTAEGLLEKIASIIEKRRKNCGAIEFTTIFRQIAGN